MRGSYQAAFAVVMSCVSAPGAAAIVASSAGGFTVREEVSLSGPPSRAWARLVDVARWWDGKHTYSGKASNLSLTLRPGGCWCESLDHGGFVRHMDVVLAIPGKTLRLTGGLGPLQGTGATGALTFTLRSSSPNVTVVVAEYSVVGFTPDGLTAMAGAVDEVLGEQMARFANQ
jgi:hypothetical protein